MWRSNVKCEASPNLGKEYSGPQEFRKETSFRTKTGVSRKSVRQGLILLVGIVGMVWLGFWVSMRVSLWRVGKSFVAPGKSPIEIGLVLERSRGVLRNEKRDPLRLHWIMLYPSSGRVDIVSTSLNGDICYLTSQGSMKEAKIYQVDGLLDGKRRLLLYPIVVFRPSQKSYVPRGPGGWEPQSQAEEDAPKGSRLD